MSRQTIIVSDAELEAKNTRLLEFLTTVESYSLDLGDGMLLELTEACRADLVLRERVR